MTDNPLNLTVGSELELDSLTDDVLNNLFSELIGYTQGQSLIISHPKKDDIPVQINSGDKFIVSMKQGDTDICFETEVVAVLNTPYLHLHTTSPANIRTGTPRKSNRVTAAPANIQLVMDGDIDNSPISILNVSCSGACLLADRRLGKVDDQFQIEFQARVGQSNVNFTCMIRYVHETHKDNHPVFNHGVVFIGMDAEEQLFLWKYFQESVPIHKDDKMGDSLDN